MSLKKIVALAKLSTLRTFFLPLTGLSWSNNVICISGPGLCSFLLVARAEMSIDFKAVLIGFDELQVSDRGPRRGVGVLLRPAAGPPQAGLPGGGVHHRRRREGTPEEQLHSAKGGKEWREFQVFRCELKREIDLPSFNFLIFLSSCEVARYVAISGDAVKVCTSLEGSN